jgi:hypothetical protein
MPDDARGACLSEHFRGDPEIGEALAALRGECLRELCGIEADDDVAPPRRGLPIRATALVALEQAPEQLMARRRRARLGV